MSKFTDYVGDEVIETKELKKVISMFMEMIASKVREQRTFDYISKIFIEVEKEHKNVKYLVMSPLDFSTMRGLAKDIYDEANYRDIIERGIFGHLWTAEIRVKKGNFEMKAYSEDQKEQMEKDFPGIFDPPKRSATITITDSEGGTEVS